MESKAELLKTIQMPKNLKHLMQRLPRAQYDDSDIVNVEQQASKSPNSGSSFNP